MRRGQHEQSSTWRTVSDLPDHKVRVSPDGIRVDEARLTDGSWRSTAPTPTAGSNRRRSDAEPGHQAAAQAGPMVALASSIRPTRAGDWVRSRAERAANEAAKVLDNGGELVPDVADPRAPRHHRPADDDADMAAVVAGMNGRTRRAMWTLGQARATPESEWQPKVPGFDGGVRGSAPVAPKSQGEWLLRINRREDAA